MSGERTITSIGWAIQVTRAAHLDEPREGWQAFSVNLVRPGASSEAGSEWSFAEPGPPIGVREAVERFDWFLLPWRWTDVQWHAYSETPGGSLTPIPSERLESGVAAPNETQRGAVCDALEKQIQGGGKHCDFAFSSSPDLQVAGKRSLVHALAPLTHYPAGLTETVFKVSCFIRVKSGAWSRGVWCFPEFKSRLIDNAGESEESWTPGAPSWHGGNGNRVDARCVYQAASGKPSVSFLCHFEDVVDGALRSRLPDDACSPGKAARDPGRRAALQHLALHLTPLGVLARAADTPEEALDVAGETHPDAPPRGRGESAGTSRLQRSALVAWLEEPEGASREAVLEAIAHSWGWGWERERGPQGRRTTCHLFEYVLGERDYRSIEKPLKDKIDVWAKVGAEELLGKFAEFLGGNLDDRERADRRILGREEAVTLRDALVVLLGDSSKREEVVSALRTVAQMTSSVDTAAGHLAEWLRFLYRDALESAWGRLQGNYTMEQVVRSRLGAFEARLRPSKKLWDALDEVVLEGSASKARLVDTLAGEYQSRWGRDWRRPIESLVGGLCEAIRVAQAEEVSTGRDRGLRLSLEDRGAGVAEGGQPLDRWIRGYAVGLESGLQLPGEEEPRWRSESAAWITDVALRVDDKEGYLTDDSSTVIALAETVGSVLRDGMRTVEIEYSGRPVVADESRSAVEGGSLLEHGYAWPVDKDTDERIWPLPILGCGLEYRAIVTPLDNAGGVCCRWARSEPARLTPAVEAFEDPENCARRYRYLSGEAPGSPRVVSASPRTLRGTLVDDRDDLSRESLAHAFLVGAWSRTARGAISSTRADEPVAIPSHERLPYVALLGAQESGLFEGGWVAPLSLAVEPPSTHSDFLRRWLSTDLQVLEMAQDGGFDPKESLSDPALGGSNAAALGRFLEEHAPEVSESRAAKPAYHPAVSAIGFVVDFWALDGDECESRRVVLPAVPIDRLAVQDGSEGRELGLSHKRRVSLKVEALASGESSQAIANMSDRTVVVKLAPGSFARVMVFSLVEEGFFDSNSGKAASSRQRYRSFLGLRGDGEDEKSRTPWSDARPEFQDESGKVRYRAFGPQEHWFEAAPPWESSSPVVSLELQAPGDGEHLGSGSPNEAVLSCPKVSGPNAPWVSGLSIERHEWHWTGYPVRLPSESKGLEEWLDSFAGVASYRETIDHRFRTLLGDDAAREGAVSPRGSFSGGEVVHRLQIPGTSRPSRYTAYVARPTVRFRRMLRANAGPLKIEDQRIAEGAVLRGVAPPPGELRLQPPPLRWTTPLTATYDAGETGGSSAPERVSNGSLLVFDEAIRRTDALTRLGGLGEGYEIDLVWSRYVPEVSEETQTVSHPEIGPNPIFHAAPQDKELQDARKQGLLVGEPFGLTYDLIRNAGVAQTAVVVRPKSNPGGKWMLAKIRTRRILLPETLLNSALQPIEENGAASGADASQELRWQVPLRRVGTEWVPIDFAIDWMADEAPGEVILKQGEERRKLETPGCAEGPANGEQRSWRLLCSWHKGRWRGGGDATWRAQVLLQGKADAALQGWSTVDRKHPFEQPDLPPLGEAAELELQLSGPTSTVVVRATHLSDYTDPEWIHIIGSFGRERLGRPDQYRLEFDANRPTEVSMRGDVPLPTLATSGEPLQKAFLFIYKPIDSVVRGDLDKSSGTMMAVYEATTFQEHVVAFTRLDWRGGEARTLDAAPDSSCYGYLLTFQKIHTAPETTASAKWPETIEALFDAIFGKREETSPSESTIRPLPQYLGPIRVVS